jgi:capsular exopolysaccharide synthesis family protein
MQRLRTAGIQAGLESLEIDIVDRATPPATPTMTPRSTLVLTWTAIGLVAGVLLAFLLESLDTGLRSIAEIESVTELPSLAIIPRAKRSSPEQIAAMSTVERNISVLTQPKSQFTEAFRSLRTALLLSTVGREPRYILFTSATPSEGKTTTASNLAVILSQRGTRVLLIDADLRRPNVHHRFGLNGKLGLSTVLSGQTTLEDSVQQVREVPGLDILASGPVPPFPTEMLSSETMTEVLRHAGELYTHVIIDSPPILSVTDGVLLSRQVDVVVMVVRHAKSSKHIVRRGRDLLIRSGAPLAGIVLNAVDLNAPEYYGYYGYTGYSYSSLDPAGWDAQNGSSKSGQKKKDKR